MTAMPSSNGQQVDLKRHGVRGLRTVIPQLQARIKSERRGRRILQVHREGRERKTRRSAPLMADYRGAGSSGIQRSAAALRLIRPLFRIITRLRTSSHSCITVRLHFFWHKARFYQLHGFDMGNPTALITNPDLTPSRCGCVKVRIHGCMPANGPLRKPSSLPLYCPSQAIFDRSGAAFR